MRTFDKETTASSSVVAWLDGVQMSLKDRENAKACLSKTEAVLDLIWLAGARMRAVFARGPAHRIPAGARLRGQKPAAVHLP